MVFGECLKLTIVKWNACIIWIYVYLCAYELYFRSRKLVNLKPFHFFIWLSIGYRVKRITYLLNLTLGYAQHYFVNERMRTDLLMFAINIWTMYEHWTITNSERIPSAGIDLSISDASNLLKSISDCDAMLWSPFGMVICSGTFFTG